MNQSPKHIRVLRGPISKRLAEFKAMRARGYKNGRATGPYYWSKPVRAEQKTRSFYLESDFMPGLRWNWCDEIARDIRHTGWYTDDHGASDTIRGVVFRLPHARGFLAGWSMGENMISEIDLYIWDDERDAAHAADGMAEHAAERERAYQREQADSDEEE